MTKRVRSVLLAAALLLALTGCMKIDADLKVSSDEKVSGKMLMAIDKGFAEQMGQSPEKLKEQIEKTVKEDLPDGVDCKPYEEGKFLGTQCALNDVPFSEMSDSGGTGLKFEKSGERFIVSGGAGDQVSEIPANFTPEVKFKITMPGKIIEKDDAAQVDGKTATYTDPKKMNSIRLVSEAGGGGVPAWLIVLLVVLVLGAAGAVVFFLLKSRNKGAQPQFPGGGQWGPQGQQQGQQQGQWGPAPQQAQHQWAGQHGPQGPPQQQGQQWGPGPQQGQQQGPPQQWGPQQGGPQQPPQQGQPPQQWGQPGQGQQQPQQQRPPQQWGPQQGQQPPQQGQQQGQQPPQNWGQGGPHGPR